ncbi:MAG TPA: PQQ-binding-like beta-propeller repeat protein, partial [Candidatus Limnocylindria bacterium]|nr:PQQ-binding-like beta-propeller repeat protein [Candidatus Limnocylindria bacterium]
MKSFMMNWRCHAAFALSLAILTARAIEPIVLNWPQFRGSGALGVADNPNLPDSWSTNENVAWKIEVRGHGWSAPIVWGERVFVTTVASEGEMEAPKKGLYFGGERKEIPKGNHRWLTLCYDLKSGRELWRQEAHRGTAPNQLHVKNSYASETPVTDGERIYAYFGNVGLFCYDMDGKKLWSTNWPPVKTRNGWGSAGSPVLHNGRVFIVNDNDNQSFAVALDAKNGRQLWRVDRDEKSNWATP